MEWWFILSLIAAVFAGLHIFIQKVGSVRGYNSSLLNTYSSGLSSVIGFAVAGVVEGFGGISWLMIAVAALSGVVYIIGSNLRMDAMRYIDATILLPLHKFVSPLVALLLGVVFFSETFSMTQLIGIVLGITVPLLLITRTERTRQVDLSRGLILMVISALFVAAGAAINKAGTDLFAAVLLFAACANAIATIAGVLLYRYRKKDVSSVIPEIHFADKKLLVLSAVSGVIQFISFAAFILAFALGGTLAIVYTIHSLYILIPIVLSIIFFKEHWNAQKAVAIILSIAALGLLR